MSKHKNKASEINMETHRKTQKTEDVCLLVVKEKKSRLTNWQEIVSEIKQGTSFLEVGATVTCNLKDGTPTEFVVTDVTDTCVRFETRDFIGDEVRWNEHNTNEGGYPASDIRKYVDSVIWDLLPEDLQAVISETDREWEDKDRNRGTYTTKLFLSAASEVFDECTCFGDERLYEQLDYYKNARNRIRLNEGGDAKSYWLSSVRIGYSEFVCLAGRSGYAGSGDASDLLRIPICFQIFKIS